jgi:hypothetical protein
VLKKILFLLFLFSSAAFSSKVEGGFHFSQGLAGSYNALGAALDTTFLYRIPLSSSTDMLWETMKIDIGVKNSLTPADERLTLYMNIEPIAIFDISVNAGLTEMYKLLGYGFVEVPASTSPLSDAYTTNLVQQDKLGFFLKVSPEFKVQVGPFILVDALDYVYLSVGGEEKFFNDRKEAAVLKFSDSLIVNNVYALYDFSNGWFAGLNYFLLINPSSGFGTQYLAGLGAYTWKLDKVSDLSFNLLIGWYLKDDFQQYNRNLPYFGLAATYNLKI